MSSVARLQLCSRLTDGQLMALFLRMVCVRVYSCTYALTHTSALCWERAMGTEISLHRMVWLFKGRQHNKRGRLGRESEIVSEWIPVICLPASGAFSVLLPWQQWLAVCVCVLRVCETRDVILPVTSVAWSWLPSCWLPWDQTDTSSFSVMNLFSGCSNHIKYILFSEKCQN